MGQSPCQISRESGQEVFCVETRSPWNKVDLAPLRAGENAGLCHCSRGTEGQSSSVTLNVYDVWEAGETLNRILRQIGTGAFHCGVEVYGREWSFQRKRDHVTGVFFCRPRQYKARTHCESIQVGRTFISDFDVQRTIARIQEDWCGDEYDILAKNCCHFCQRLCEELGVDNVPSWITSLSGTGRAVTDAAKAVEDSLELDFDGCAGPTSSLCSCGGNRNKPKDIRYPHPVCYIEGAPEIYVYGNGDRVFSNVERRRSYDATDILNGTLPSNERQRLR